MNPINTFLKKTYDYDWNGRPSTGYTQEPDLTKPLTILQFLSEKDPRSHSCHRTVAVCIFNNRLITFDIEAIYLEKI